MHKAPHLGEVQISPRKGDIVFMYSINMCFILANGTIVAKSWNALSQSKKLTSKQPILNVSFHLFTKRRGGPSFENKTKKKEEE